MESRLVLRPGRFACSSCLPIQRDLHRSGSTALSPARRGPSRLVAGAVVALLALSSSAALRAQQDAAQYWPPDDTSTPYPQSGYGGQPQYPAQSDTYAQPQYPSEQAYAGQ